MSTPEQENHIDQFPNLSEKIPVKRSLVNFSSDRPDHIKDPGLTRGEGKYGLQVPQKGPDGYYILNTLIDLNRTGGERRWARWALKTLGGKAHLLNTRKEDDFGVRLENVDRPNDLLKMETVFDTPYAQDTREVAFFSTGGNGNQIEIATSARNSNTIFEGQGGILQAERNEMLYDPFPFIDEDGKKKLLIVSKRGDSGEFFTVGSADNTWTSKEWINRKTLLTGAEIPSQHDPQRDKVGDLEWILESPKITRLPIGRKIIAILTATGFFSPPVWRSFRQHSLFAVRDGTDGEGKWTFGGILTRHTLGSRFDDTTGEVGAPTTLNKSGGDYIVYQQAKAYGGNDVVTNRDQNYVFDGYHHPGWTIETLRFPQREFNKLAMGLLRNPQ